MQSDTSSLIPQYINPNRYIMNNSNQFLVSPYSPSQVVQNTNTQSVIRADVILPYTAGGTIQIQSPINVQNLTIQGTVGGDANKVSNSSTSLECTADAIVGTIAGSQEVQIGGSSATFGTVTAGNYVFNVNGQFGLTTTLDTVGTYGIVGFTPFSVNSVQYYMPLYGTAGPFIQPLPPPSDTPGGTDVIDPATSVSYVGGTTHTLGGSAQTGQMKTISSTAPGVTVTGTFYKDGATYTTLTFPQSALSAILTAYSGGWIVVSLDGVEIG